MRYLFGALALVLCVAGSAAAGDMKTAAASGPDWSMNSTVIEACSCPMFCQCYFASATGPNSGPAGHAGHEGHGAEHFCRFNNAYKINRGHFGATNLDGAMFWLSGDLGDSFADGQMDWAVITFDKKTTKEQRDAIGAIIPRLFPVTWKSVTTAEGDISWVATKDEAHALLDGGKSGEVQLKRFQGMTDEPVVMKNLKYWGASHNDGFVMMPASLHAYRAGDKTYEFKNSNGFMLTLDVDSKTAPPPAGSGGGKAY